MCGRYSMTQDANKVSRRFGVQKPPEALAARYNIAPSQDAAVIVEDDGRQLRLFRWGLIPAWAKEPSIGYRMINARAETILEKPSYKRPFQKQRCLVVADGFYEWRREPGGKKTPMRITLAGGEPFAMAGLWDAWKDPSGKELRSFTIITTAASPAVSSIHDRMPVILDEDGERAWLDPKVEAQALLALLAPREDGLTSYEVSPLVNSPANDQPLCARPVSG